MKKTYQTCNGCTHQLKDGRPAIRASNYKYLRYEDVKNVCDTCYSWSNRDEIRRNYEYNTNSDYSVQKFIDNIFEGI